MGLFSFLADSFMEGYNNGRREKPIRSRSSHCVPHTFDLIYPSILPRFDELAGEGHSNPRAVIYTILRLDPLRKKPFSAEELSALDFGEGKGGVKAAYRVLLDKGLIRELPPDKLLSSLYTADEIKDLLRKRKLPVRGNKTELVERLLGGGFMVDRRSARHMLFELTEVGAGMIAQYTSDVKRAILLATDALKEADYSKAISAYRGFDNKWGFVHTSGKSHTIFAHCDIPFSRFDFIASYPMCELDNTDDFKNSLRSCLIAGLMRGCYDRFELANCFDDICREQIRCPGIVGYYAQGRFDDGPDEDVLAAMRKNVASDNRYTLEYYISRVLHLSRQAQ